MPFKLVVFDLDFTIWNAGGTWCDHTTPPYRRVNNHICDSQGSVISIYPEVKEILNQLQGNYELAVASRTHRSDWALELMQLFRIMDFFDHLEIYPGSKVAHFRRLHHITRIEFSEMIFFDDEIRNVDEVSELGVKSVLVREGITNEILNRSL